MKNYQLYKILFLFVLFSCTRNDYIEPLQIIVSNPTFELQTKTLNVDFRIQNNSDTTYLFLAFGNIHPVASGDPEKWLKQPNIPAGHAFLIYDLNNKNPVSEIHPHDWPDDWAEGMAPPDKHNKYIENMLIVEPGDTTVSFSKSFRFYEFKEGEHFGKSIYYFGNNSVNFVDSTLQIELEKKYNAKIFRGFLESRTVKVEYKN